MFVSHHMIYKTKVVLISKEVNTSETIDEFL